jgi:hypothetical protein
LIPAWVTTPIPSADPMLEVRTKAAMNKSMNKPGSLFIVISFPFVG